MTGEPSSRAVSALGKILLYLLVVILVAGVVSPPIYWVLHEALPFPFPRYFSRIAQVAAFVLLIPLLLWLRIRSVREFGLARNGHAWRDLVAGFVIALIPIVLLAVMYVALDAYRIRKEWIPGTLLRIAGTAGVVACVEEFLFRGVLLGLSARAFGRLSAALGVSAIFAGVHFLRPGKSEAFEVGWWSGFAQIGRIFEAAPPWPLLGLGLLSLFAAGMILAYATLETRSLWLAIGLHAAWVFGQQTLHLVARYRLKPPDAWLPWLGPNVVSGAVPTGIVPLSAILLTGAGVWLYLRNVGRP